MQNAVALTKELMAKYGIGVDGVCRHYDVTRKICPAPWVNDPAQWEDFKKRLTATGEPSAWAKDACQWAIEKGLFQGDGGGEYHWQDPITREQIATVLYRLFGK
jgi:N-acetylmuramoyl-L-alanine amidase CwlA